MEKREILEKVQEKKAVVGEMEREKINKSNWIAVIVVGILAISFMVIEGLLHHFSSIYAIATLCFAWASVFYFCQFFIAKRPKGVLIGAILEGIGAIIMLVKFILCCVGGV